LGRRRKLGGGSSRGSGRKVRLRWENRAWEKAEHPRLVSNAVKVGGSEYVFEIGYHWPMKKYMLDINETKDYGRGRPETYGRVKFFDSIPEAKKEAQRIASGG